MSSEHHELTVTDVGRQGEDAVTLTFELPPEVREEFRYQPGQYVMVRFMGADGEEEFRSYSVCHAPPADGSAPSSVRIAVRLLGLGGFGEVAHRKLGPGSTVGVLRPRGRFRLRAGRRHFAVAAGSGITPVLAMAQAALLRGDEFALVYGNRTASSTMFAADIAELESRFPGRFTVRHVLSREKAVAPHRTGRIDADDLRRLLETVGWAPDDEATQFYVCGPAGLVGAVRGFLSATGVDRRRMHSELFAVAALNPEA
ncbi:FAD-binding oxidoreductase [Streptomyces sp. UNOC14_S4]|uniref:FAD-binding oxidoreductase n=1 Tax=Streptomyces sp. UNOC14_S4 TaxID=2872340 RepID=UPI001E5557C6|nr:FAD-binding oxidoreductase [Streptomyces sp. UNOC14_S4]MCC3767313.1 hypothetical protein [Streptomyces sp. UNOC14_S4]